MADWSLIAKGALEDAAGLAEDLGHLFRKHGAHAVALSTDQFQGDPRDIPAQEADPNAPIEATPAVAEPGDAAPATDDTRDSDVSRETAAPGPPRVYSGVADTRDDLPAADDDEHDPGPVPEKP